MFSFNKYKLLLAMLDLTEQAGDSYSELSDYLVETVVPVLDPVKLNEAGGEDKLHTAISNLAAKARQMASEHGGNENENLQNIFKQSATTYGKATKDKQSVAALWNMVRSGGASAFTATATMILGAALVGSSYGPEKAKEVVHRAAASHGAPAQPALPAPAQRPAQMGESANLTEGTLDLMHLPADVIAWLYDRPEEQMKAAKEVGVAAAETGNKIARGAVLRSDVNVLVLHDRAGKGKFHVYPDGSISFNGEMIDGHEDVERLVGTSTEHEDIATGVVSPQSYGGMDDLGGMDMDGPSISVATFEVVPSEGPEGDGMEHFAGMPDDEPMDPRTAMESLTWDDLLDEGKTADRFRSVKDKIMKKNPKAKTPKLDQVIDMWSKVEE